MARSPNWSKEELTLALELYLETPFAKISANDPRAIELGKAIGRSSNAVAIKLANFARLDPDLKARNLSGMQNGSKLDIEVWNDFYLKWEKLYTVTKNIKRNIIIQNKALIDLELLGPLQKTEKMSARPVRTKQRLFRNMVLASYDCRCCLSGFENPKLLIASHIVPWAEEKLHRLNPQNGLCLSPLFDRAFDVGLMTVLPMDFTVKISEHLLKGGSAQEAKFFKQYQGKPMTLPDRLPPKPEFLEYHNKNVFLGS